MLVFRFGRGRDFAVSSPLGFWFLPVPWDCSRFSNPLTGRTGFMAYSRPRMPRVFGPYVNRDHFAGLMEMLLPLAILYIASQHGRLSLKVGVTISAVMLALAALLLSGSRGGAAGIIRGDGYCQGGSPPDGAPKGQIGAWPPRPTTTWWRA